jgi:hypothetical protein
MAKKKKKKKKEEEEEEEKEKGKEKEKGGPVQTTHQGSPAASLRPGPLERRAQTLQSRLAGPTI